jgi:hypothetical protein
MNSDRMKLLLTPLRNDRSMPLTEGALYCINVKGFECTFQCTLHITKTIHRNTVYILCKIIAVAVKKCTDA